jgi:beta-glucosidase
MLSALNEKLVEPEDIRKACVHLMRTRTRLGMFDGGTEYDKIPYSVVACDEHKTVSWNAPRSQWYCSNNGILPLDSGKIRTIGVIGPMPTAALLLRGITAEQQTDITPSLKE